MSWFSLLRGSTDELRPIERAALSAVAGNLSGAARERFLSQLGAINMVQRHARDKEVNLYRIERGKPAFDNALRFPLNRPEVRLATVSFSGPSSGKRLRADVWMANGRVFSVSFDRSPKGVSLDDVNVASVKILVNPMEIDTPLAQLRDIGALRAWLGSLADRYKITDAKEPLPRETLDAFLIEIDYSLPDDFMALSRITGGFRISDCTVHNPLSARMLVLDDGEFVVLAETPKLSVLAVSRDGSVKGVLRLHPDETKPKAMDDQFRRALERFVEEDSTRLV